MFFTFRFTNCRLLFWNRQFFSHRAPVEPDCDLILAGMKDVFAAPDKSTAQSRLKALVRRLEQPYPQMADWLDEDGLDTLAVYDFP